jgi:hypothetical protein
MVRPLDDPTYGRYGKAREVWAAAILAERAANAVRNTRRREDE